MNRVLKTFAFPTVALAALLGLVPAAALAADVKPLGVIDSERIVQEYGAAKDAQTQYQKFLQDLERDITDREKELQRLAEEIESQRMLLGEDALGQKMQDFEDRKSDYFTFRESLETKAENEYKVKIQPIIDQVKLIAERVGKEEGFGIIIDTAALTTVYIDPEVDLTDRILSALVRGVEE
ncbi:OmpH family outer membrane protein [bacterium]|nr:OmpH family outer membrane protein [bacterium]MBU1073196.1 OmpH family outer membrane protein [bacterium]MBU1676298.1 OmpH family outer membrane protein [bacterium]